MSDDATNIDDLQAAIEALRAKNSELLSELKQARAKAKGAEIDPAEHAALQHQVEELQGKLENQTKLSAKEIEKLQGQLSEKDGALQSYLIDNGLHEAMLKVGIRPEMTNAVKAMLRSQAKIKADGGSYSALIGDKPLMDAISEWAASDEGKHFIAAPANAGGGAPGGNGTPGIPKGNLGGDRNERVNALRSRFPELANA